MNNSKTNSAGEVLASLSGGKKSGWSERARQRQENSAWLRRSQRIALHVLNVLDAKAMSQKDLAIAINVTPQYVSKLLKGGENLSLETISRIEHALSIVLIAVRDCAHTLSIMPQKVKAVQRPAQQVVAFTAVTTYHRNQAPGAAFVPDRGSFYSATAQC